MKPHLITSIALINIVLLLSCQMKQKNKSNLKIAYNVETTHPSDQLKVEFVSDTIFTLGGGEAHIPFGGTSGEWGQSNAMFTKQSGIPERVKIIYYALYEDVFYDLDIKLPVERMKDLMDRAYAINESKVNKTEMKEFIRISEHPNYEEEFNLYNTSYSKVTDFVLGFSPQGKVTIWLRYNRVQKLIGDFKATAIIEDKKVSKEFYSRMAVGREKARELFYKEKETSDQWNDFLYNSKWKIKPILANDQSKVLEINLKYFNKEAETLLRPWLLKDEFKQRGVPEMMTVSWESANSEAYYAHIFYDWNRVFSAFKKNRKDEVFKISINEDHKSLKTHLGSEEIIPDRIQIFKNDVKYRDSY